MLENWILRAIFVLFWAGYFWLRFGPKRCPRCRTWVFGYWGVPVGIRMMHFHCKRCGMRFVGNKRLPV
jgi:hypothetical protein